MAFVPHPDFWQGAPKLEQVIVQFVADDAAQVNALKSGQTEVAAFLPYAELAGLKSLESAPLVKLPAGYKESWFFNLSAKGHPALQDVRVRQAIVMAINRDKLAQDLMFGLGKLPVTFWDGTPYAPTDAKPLPFDPEAAKKLLDEAGWTVGKDGIREKDGLKLRLRYVTTTRETRRQAQMQVTQMLQAVGVAVDLATFGGDLLFNSYADKGPLAMGQYDIAQWSLSPAYIFPEPGPEFISWRCADIPSAQNPAGRNWQGVCDPELDALFAQTAVMDIPARTAAFQRIALMLNSKVYWVGLWDDSDWWAVSKKVQNVKLSAANPFWNIYEWDMTP
jgi:peptide/nickel transport system substrate-binding protein